MSGSNEKLAEFLNYYLHLNVVPEYAVLLRGNWGTGKTWFAKQELEKFKAKGGNYLYVSLYGVSSFNGIEEEFFRQLHPVLASKQMKFIGRLFKGAIKATIKIDLDSDGKGDDNISIRAPELNLPDYLKDTSKLALVFDDLERCSIDICSLLGYINQFVEHSGQKVILIANEEEIIARDNKNEHTLAAYGRIKEKLIGKTFEIQPDTDAAIEVFLSKIEKDSAIIALGENAQSIKSLYLASQYLNLRHLRQALLDLERILDVIQSRFLQKKELISNLIQFYLIFSFELKSGNLNSKDLASVDSNSYWSVFDTKTDGEKSLYKKLSEKYSEVDLQDKLLPSRLWASIFTTGYLDLPAIEEAFSNSRYFITESQPDWVQLWHALNLTDEEANRILAIVLERFSKKEYCEIGEIRHIAGMLLWFADLKIVAKTRTQIVKETKKYIDHLKSSGKLPLGRDLLARMSDSGGWAGLGYHSIETSEFREIMTYSYEKAEEALTESYPAIAIKLLVDMRDETDKFYRQLNICNHPESKYYKTPILHLIKPIEFCQVFAGLTQAQRRSVGLTIEERYKNDHYARDLLLEEKWLLRVKTLLKREQANRKGTVSGFYYGHVAEVCIEAVNKLKSLRLQLQSLNTALIEGEESGDAGELNMESIMQEARKEAE